MLLTEKERIIIEGFRKDPERVLKVLETILKDGEDKKSLSILEDLKEQCKIEAAQNSVKKLDNAK
ncbi:MAG: hypothetical protein ACI4IW_04560 [Oscillospiraceae bacterium]